MAQREPDFPLALGLDYRLVTRRTSLFAPDEGVEVNPEPRDVAVGCCDDFPDSAGGDDGDEGDEDGAAHVGGGDGRDRLTGWAATSCCRTMSGATGPACPGCRGGCMKAWRVSPPNWPSSPS